MSYKVSVVVPVYNTEKYLEKCINSIIGQTFKDIEILIVDDKSTDNSSKIILEYENKYENIKYIENDINSGVSVSRNKAIGMCSGEYILFVDSDDYLEPDTIQCMYDEAKKHELDIVMCGYFVDFEDGNTNKKIISLDDEEIYDGKEVLTELLHHKSGVTGHSWNKLIRRELLVENKLEYPTDMHLYEDVALFTMLYPRCKKIKNIKRPFYHYIQRGQSAVKTVNKNIIIDTTKCIKRVREVLESNKLISSLEDEFIAFESRMVSIAMHKIYSYSSDSNIQIEYLDELINSDCLDIRHATNNIKDKYIFDNFHGYSLKSLKSGDYSTKKVHKKYKTYIASYAAVLKMYKKVRPVVKKFR